MKRDPLEYHKFAHWLAKRFYSQTASVGPDDLYQIAIVGLLELWRTEPNASVRRCEQAMRKAVSQEVTRHIRRLESHPQVPLIEARDVITPERPERTVIDQEAVECIGRAMGQLPDGEFQVLALKVMGYNPVQLGLSYGWPLQQTAQLLRLGRQRLRKYLEEMSA